MTIKQRFDKKQKVQRARDKKEVKILEERKAKMYGEEGYDYQIEVEGRVEWIKDKHLEIKD